MEDSWLDHVLCQLSPKLKVEIINLDTINCLTYRLQWWSGCWTTPYLVFNFLLPIWGFSEAVWLFTRTLYSLPSYCYKYPFDNLRHCPTLWHAGLGSGPISFDSSLMGSHKLQIDIYGLSLTVFLNYLAGFNVISTHLPVRPRYNSKCHCRVLASSSGNEFQGKLAGPLICSA